MHVSEAWAELKEWLYTERACEDGGMGEDLGSISAWKAYDSALREMRNLELEIE